MLSSTSRAAAKLLLIVLCFTSCEKQDNSKTVYRVFDFEMTPNFLPIVKGSFDKEPINALFDLGCDQTKVRNEFSQVKLLERTGKSYRIKNADEHVFIGDECIIPSLVFKNLTFEKIRGIVCQDTSCNKEDRLEQVDESLQYSFILGRELYDNESLVIDYRSKKIVIASNRDELESMGYDTRDWLRTKMDYNDDGVHLIAESRDETGAPSFVVLLLDTGANINAIKPGNDYEGIGKYEPSHIYVSINGLSLEDKPFNPGFFYLYDLNYGEGVDGILGYPFFEKHLVLLDFPNRQIYLKPIGG